MDQIGLVWLDGVRRGYTLFAVIGTSLRLRPNLKTGMLLRGRPDSSAALPHPQITVTSLRARCRTLMIGAV